MAQLIADIVTAEIVDGESMRRQQAPAKTGARRDRSSRGSGRRVAPTLRPMTGCPGPGSVRPTAAGWVGGGQLVEPGVRSASRSCRVAAPGVAQPVRSLGLASRPVKLRRVAVAANWRLTERGIAVVLVTGLMLMVAAATVIGLTAAKVTSSGYRTPVAAALPM